MPKHALPTGAPTLSHVADLPPRPSSWLSPALAGPGKVADYAEAFDALAYPGNLGLEDRRGAPRNKHNLGVWLVHFVPMLLRPGSSARFEVGEVANELDADS